MHNRELALLEFAHDQDEMDIYLSRRSVDFVTIQKHATYCSARAGRSII